MKYYVYYLIDPRTSQPFYIGKGQGDRIDQHEKDVNRKKIVNPIKHHLITNILNDGFKIKKKIFKYFDDESEAYLIEQQLIQKYGRIFNDTGCLTNISSGGSTYTKEPVPVNQYTYFGDYIRTFVSTREAIKYLGTKHTSSISNAITGRIPSYKGYLWGYKGCNVPTVPKTVIYCWSLQGRFLTKYKNEGDAARALGGKQAHIHDHLTRGGTCKGYVLSRTPNFPGIQARRFKVWEKKLSNKSVKHINSGKIYDSVTSAALDTKHNVGTICKICQGRKSDVSGDKFMYLDKP